MLNANNNFSAGNLNVEIMEVIGGLNGNEVLRIQEYIYKCLDKGRCYYIIDLEQTNKIDGLGIAMLENFLSRGLQIRLVNVKPEIQWVMNLAKKEIFHQIIHNEKDRAGAVSLFEKYILEKKDTPGGGAIKKRHNVRVGTYFTAEFKFQKNHDTIFGKGKILNLSQDGILLGHIAAVKKSTEEIIHNLEMVGQDIYDLKFGLDTASTTLVLQGTCVREFIVGESIYAGIQFKDINFQQGEIIRSFVNANR